MKLWLWLCIVIVCAALSPILILLWKFSRTVSRVNSPSFRLQMANFWTEIQHVQNGGATQIMKMQDGNFILLSVGLDTTKVFVGPTLDSIESFVEMASFPIRRSGGDPRSHEAILNTLRPAIGWPKSVGELRVTLSRLMDQNLCLG